MNRSPSPGRVARVAAVIHSGGKILMVACPQAPHGWTLPGGGVNQGETLKAAAIREAWEEAGATVRIERKLCQLEGELVEHYFLALLERLEPSPEGRERRWIEPLHADWREDKQIKLLSECGVLSNSEMVF